jgi:hypothetical protein
MAVSGKRLRLLFVMVLIALAASVRRFLVTPAANSLANAVMAASQVAV